MNVARTIIAVALVVAALVSTGLLAVVLAAVRVLPRSRVRRLRDAGARGSVALDRLAERPGRLAASAALVTAISYALVSAVGAWALGLLWPELPNWANGAAAVLAAVVVLFSLGEALPRTLALANPEGVGLAAAGPAGRLAAIAYPAARGLSLLWARLVALITGERGVDVPWTEPDEERRPVSASDEEQSRHDDEQDAYLGAVSDLRAKIVREVMVPRPDMVAIEDTADAQGALAAISAAGVSRVPVYHEDLDDIVGVLYAKDLLSRLGAGDMGVCPVDIARPAFFVPETKPVEELLREMRRRTHIAIVADEYGGTAGLVTIEDLLEEIVGEIYDEYDPQVALVTERESGTFAVDARLSVTELDERFGTSLDVEADTVGGLFTELAGRIPQVGDSVHVEGLRLTVEEMEGTRVRQLVVEPAPPIDSEETDA